MSSFHIVDVVNQKGICLRCAKVEDLQVIGPVVEVEAALASFRERHTVCPVFVGSPVSNARVAQHDDFVPQGGLQ